MESGVSRGEAVCMKTVLIFKVRYDTLMLIMVVGMRGDEVERHILTTYNGW